MDNESTETDQAPRALIALSPEIADRLRDPRTSLGVALVVAGAIAVFVGYWGVSDTLDPGKQLPYIISGGIGGLFLLGAGVAVFFSSELAELRRQQGEVMAAVLELRDQLATRDGATTTTTDELSSTPANGTARAKRVRRAVR